MFPMNPEVAAEKENNTNSMCSKQQQQQQQHHPQQLKSSRPTSNWYIGRRPRTAFTNSQVINQSINQSVCQLDK